MSNILQVFPLSLRTSKGGEPKDQNAKSIEVFRERRIDKKLQQLIFLLQRDGSKWVGIRSIRAPPCTGAITRPSILCVTPKMTFRTCLTQQKEDLHKPYGLYVRVVLDSKWWNWINKGQY